MNFSFQQLDKCSITHAQQQRDFLQKATGLAARASLAPFLVCWAGLLIK
jgi:hypothetical protein